MILQGKIGIWVKMKIWSEMARNFNVEKPLFKAIFWVQQILFRPSAGFSNFCSGQNTKKGGSNRYERTKTVFDTQKTMVVNPRVGRFSGDGWGISGGIFLGLKWVVFVDTVLEMIPARFRFEHYSPWPNVSFPGFVNARTSPHKNKEHQRKPSYQEREKTWSPTSP